jgi:hypothetical protein
MKPREDTPLSLEQLLRLKRAERPPADFWERFDAELRQKQLAAIVEKTPWWAGLGRLAEVLVKPNYYLPIGTTTALALAFFGFHGTEFNHDANAPVRKPGSIAMAVIPAKKLDSIAPEAVAVRSALSVQLAPRPAFLAVSQSPSPALPEEIAPGEVLERIPSDRSASGNFTGGPEDGVLSQMEGQLAALRQDDGGRLRLVRPHSAEPLAQIISPVEERRSRLLAETLPANAFAINFDARTNERASNLTEDRLLETTRRYHFDADDQAVKVSFKF